MHAHQFRERFTVDWISATLVGLMLAFQMAALYLVNYIQTFAVRTPEQSADLSIGVNIVALAAVEIAGILILWKAWKLLPEKWRKWISKALKYGLLVSLYYITFYLYYLDGSAVFYVVAVAVTGTTLVYISRNDLSWILFNLSALSLGVCMVAIASFSIAPIVVIVVMLAFLIYDHIAVNLSDIMASLIDFSSSTGLPNYVVIPTSVRFDMSSVRDFLTGESDEKPETLALMIGVGDFAFPTFLTVSAYVQNGLTLAVVGALSGTLIATIVLRDSLERAEKGLPALPWLNTGAIVGFSVGAIAGNVTLITALGL